MTHYRDIDYSNLGWVRKELNATLNEVSQALEAYIAEPADTAQLRFCVTYLHQVRSILQMLELYGASMLAEEMELLAQALVNDSVGQRQEAYEVLIRAILQLSDYLERIEHGRRDLPILMLPLMNDLRAMRGANLLTENAFFNPDFSRAPIKLNLVWSEAIDEEARSRAKQLRPIYQLALLGWLRKRGTDNLRRLGEVLRRLETSSSIGSAATLWWIGGGVIEALYLQALEPSVAVNMLLGHLDRQIKRVADAGEKVFETSPAIDLSKNLLYYVAQSNSLGERVVSIQKQYNLKTLMPRADELDKAREEMSGPTVAMLETVANAIKEDLTSVKDSLDMAARSGAVTPSDLRPLIDTLRRVADTLGMLGLGLARKVVVDQSAAIQRMVDQEVVADEQRLLESASALLFVEAEVDDLLTPGARRAETDVAEDATPSDDSLLAAEYHRVLALVVKEALSDLTRAKDILIDYSVSPDNHDRLNDVPMLFRSIGGALSIVEMQPASQVLRGLLQFLNERVIQPRRAPTREHFDELAETISSLEYHLEAIRDRRSQADIPLRNAISSLSRLIELPATVELSAAVPYQIAVTGGTGTGAAGFGSEFVERLEVESTVPDHDVGGVMEVIELEAIPLPGETDEAVVALDVEAYPWLAEDADPEILEVFFEESEELRETLESSLQLLRANHGDLAALTDVRRVYHTLKGSGRLAGSPMIGEMFWSCEQVMNQVLANVLQADTSLIEFISETSRALPEMVERLRSGKNPSMDPMQFIARIEQRYNLPRTVSRAASAKPKKPAILNEDEDPEPAELTEGGGDEVAQDNGFFEAFRAEASGPINDIKTFVDAIETGQSDGVVTAPVLKAIEKLSAVASDANVTAILRLLNPISRYLQVCQQSRQILSAAAVNLIGECVALFEAIQAAPDTQEADILGFSEMVQRAHALIEVAAPVQDLEKAPAAPLVNSISQPVDADLVTLFLEEAEETIGYLESTAREWRDDVSQTEHSQGIQRALHTLKGGARMAGFMPVAELSHAMESLLVSVKEGTIPLEAIIFDEFQLALDRLIELLECAASGKQLNLPTEAIARLTALRVSTSAHGEHALGAPTSSDSTSDEALHDVDTELAQVFLEESVETLVGAESALQRWKDHPGDRGPVADLQRFLHTLKGGARMAGFVPIGNLAHQMESLLTRVVQRGSEPEQTIFEILDLCYDRLLEMLERARSGKPVGSVADLVEQLDLLRFDVAKLQSEAPAEAAEAEQSSLPVDLERIKPRLQGDMVRVAADLLDRLVGYAGEISIYRARLGQQVSAIGFNVVELEQTVIRLREQLRKLEIEAEAQIIFRNEDMFSASREGFDALEFDRFSQLQQLSRALAESVGDLVSIHGLLASLARESEVLLGQQARLNTELQEGLTHTRMVPFSSLVPRLRRIVRQTAHELGKRAELDIIGADGEMDRTVLERITAPLEHMLRNALAHGVESPAERRRVGKAEVGRISVRFARESSEVVMVVADDGAGMDIDAIRKKALQRGLIKDDSKISDHEIMQFVLEAGFSTAQQVTQIAGRGVGMDVVHSEIKQMGGSLTINSARGKGTSFSARLPFTLAINQALLVYAGPEVYAVPLAAIEGVVRVSQEDLLRCEQQDGGAYIYASQRYNILNLSYLLGLGEPEWSSSTKRVPLLLVQAGDQRVALQVDGLMGSREIVVKSVGPQLSTIAGLMGATILGDGRVVIILDIIALARIGIALKAEGANAVVPKRVDIGGKIRVMVVDDSITVRKVTARFLERNNMVVVTAKDGVDAIARLNEEVPDIMLLDIEMPRMDGFELATHVRNDSKLKHLPIIMITSRTGEKHRQRAFDIGVDRYLGKPYQESELLENIVSVLSEARVHG